MKNEYYPMVLSSRKPGFYTWDFASDSTAYCLAKCHYPNLAENVERFKEQH